MFLNKRKCKQIKVQPIINNQSKNENETRQSQEKNQKKITQRFIIQDNPITESAKHSSIKNLNTEKESKEIDAKSKCSSNYEKAQSNSRHKFGNSISAKNDCFIQICNIKGTQFFNRKSLIYSSISKREESKQ